MAAEGNNRHSQIKRWGGNLLALALLALLVWKADLHSLLAALGNLTTDTIVILLLLAAALVYVSALKWSLFVTFFGGSVSVVYLFLLYLVGYFINLVVPSYIGGDAVRSWYAGKRAGQHQAFASTILERYTGFVAMIFLAMIFVWIAPGVTDEIKLVVITMALGLVVLTMVSLSPRLIALVGRLPIVGKLSGHLEKVQSGLHAAKGDCRLLTKAMALSFVYHSLTIANTLAAAYAVGWWEASAIELFVVVPVILLIGAIPITPGGLGLQEGAFFVLLQGIGATAPQALGIGLILRAKSYLLALIGGVIFPFIKRESARRNGAVEGPATPGPVI